MEGGVELPRAELRVEEDFVVGTVPLDSFEESRVRKLALLFLLRSLKNGMSTIQSRRQSIDLVMNDQFAKVQRTEMDWDELGLALRETSAMQQACDAGGLVIGNRS